MAVSDKDSNSGRRPGGSPTGSRAVVASLTPQGKHAGKPAISLKRPVVVIGSRSNCRIHLISRSISRAHALVVQDGQQVYIRDLASRTGVLINERAVREAVLRDRDVITLGSFTFQYSAARARSSGREIVPPAPTATVRRVDGGGTVRIVDEASTPDESRVALIGRRDSSDVPLDDESVSTAHAAVFCIGGHHAIRDLGSRTGTFVNGAAIHQQTLVPGDRIQIGPFELRLALEETAAHEAAPPAEVEPHEARVADHVEPHAPEPVEIEPAAVGEAETPAADEAGHGLELVEPVELPRPAEEESAPAATAEAIAPAEKPAALPEPAAEQAEPPAGKRRGWRLFSWGRRKEEPAPAPAEPAEAEVVEPELAPIPIAPEDEAPAPEVVEAAPKSTETVPEAPAIEPLTSDEAEPRPIELPDEPIAVEPPAVSVAEPAAIDEAALPELDLAYEPSPIEMPAASAVEPPPVAEAQPLAESPAPSAEPALELADIAPTESPAEITPPDEAELLSLDLSLESPTVEPPAVSPVEAPVASEFEPFAVAEPEAPAISAIEPPVSGALESPAARTIEPFELDQTTVPPRDDGGVSELADIADIAGKPAAAPEEPAVEPARFAERVPVSKTRVRPEPVATQLAETVSPTEPTPDSALPLIELGTEPASETATPFGDSIGTLNDDDLAALAGSSGVVLGPGVSAGPTPGASTAAPGDVAELSRDVTEFAGSGLGELVIEPPEVGAAEPVVELSPPASDAIEAAPPLEEEEGEAAATVEAPTPLLPPMIEPPSKRAPETIMPVVFPPMAPAPGRSMTPAVAPGTLGGFGGLQGGPSILPAARGGEAPYVPPVVVPPVSRPPQPPPARRVVAAKGLASIADEAKLAGGRRLDETIPPFDPLRPAASAGRSPRPARGQIVPLFGSARLAEPGLPALGGPAKTLDAADVVKGLAPSTIDSRAFAGAGQAVPPHDVLTPVAVAFDEQGAPLAETEAKLAASDDSAVTAALGIPTAPGTILSASDAETLTAARLRRLERGRISRRRLRRVWLCLAGAPVLAAIAAAGGWMLAPVHSVIEAHVVFTGLEKQNRHDRNQFQGAQLARLVDRDARSAAIVQLHRGDTPQVAPGFLDDPTEYYAVVSAGTFSEDQPNTLILRRQGSDLDGDRARLKAIVNSMYAHNANLQDQAGRAVGKVQRLQDDINQGKRQRDDLQKQTDQLQLVAQARPSPADLSAAEGQLNKLQQAYEDARTARLRNEADINHLSEVNPQPTTAPGVAALVPAPSTQPSDTELTSLSRDLAEVDRKTEEARRARLAEQDKARAALDAAMTQFQHQVDSAKQLTQSSPQLTAYIASAQKAFDSAHGIVNDFIHQQEQTYTALTDLRARLNEKMDQRRAKLWAGDKELKELNDRLEIAKRQYNAAIAGALTKEADDYKAQIELLTNMIRAREDLTPQDPVYADVVAQLQQLIDSQRKKLDENRATAQTAMDALAAQLQQSHPAETGLSQDQKSLPAELEQRLADVNAARRRYADASGAPDNDEASRKLAEQRQQLLTSIEARRNAMADAASQQDRARDDQQRTTQLAALRQQHDKLVGAENDALAAFNQKDRDLAAMRQRDVDGRSAEARLADIAVERASVQAGLEQANRDLNPAQEDANLAIIQAPMNEESDLRVAGSVDRRPLAALAGGGSAALLMLGMAGINLLGMTRHVRSIDARAKRLRSRATASGEPVVMADVADPRREEANPADEPNDDQAVDPADSADAPDGLELDPIDARAESAPGSNGSGPIGLSELAEPAQDSAPDAPPDEDSFLDALRAPDSQEPQSSAEGDAKENGDVDHSAHHLF